MWLSPVVWREKGPQWVSGQEACSSSFPEPSSGLNMYVHFKPSSNSLHPSDNDPMRTVTAVSQAVTRSTGGGSHLPAATEITVLVTASLSTVARSGSCSVDAFRRTENLCCACIHTVLGEAKHSVERLKEPEVSTCVRNRASHMRTSERDAWPGPCVPRLSPKAEGIQLRDLGWTAGTYGRGPGGEEPDARL